MAQVTRRQPFCIGNLPDTTQKVREMVILLTCQMWLVVNLVLSADELLITYEYILTAGLIIIQIYCIFTGCNLMFVDDI